ncbi:MAG: ComF family protein [Firmicutes bacterium]|nr:ComF family protein [Bacillota bacterium]
MSIKFFINGLLDVFFPPLCVFCGCFDEKSLCKNCRKKIEFIGNSCCKLCGYPLNKLNDSAVCDCKVERFSFEKAVSAAVYEGSLKDAIHRFKYYRKKVLAHAFSRLMEECYRNFIKDPVDFIVPVPLFKKKESERGYNQSELLAKNLGKFLGIPVRNFILRIKDTASQTKLGRTERRENVKSAFQYQGPPGMEAKVLIVDDIMTTGATVNECARILKEAGNFKVYVLTLARGVKQD